MSTPDVKASELERREQALAATVRALAGKADLEVTFRAQPTAAAARSATRAIRLPPLRPDLDPADLARIRGEADGAALRERLHDPVVHRRFAPSSELAALLFDRLEQVRVEAVGSEHLLGVRRNLAVAHRARLGAARDGRVDTTMADIVDLYVRERLLGLEPGEGQRELLARWRDWLDSKVAAELPALETSLADQETFARRVREMLVHLGLAEEALEEGEEGEGAEEPEARPEQGEGQPEDAGQVPAPVGREGLDRGRQAQRPEGRHQVVGVVGDRAAGRVAGADEVDDRGRGHGALPGRSGQGTCQGGVWASYPKRRPVWTVRPNRRG